MAEEIREMPLDIQDISQKVEEILDKNDEMEKPSDQVVEETPEEIIEQIESREEPEEKKVARPKGRPKGALNKAPSKPRAKKKTAPRPKEESVDPIEEERHKDPKIEFEIPWGETPRRRICDSDLATQMFRLLQQQENARVNRKRQLYASWFQ